jgi:hypothetical protein
MKDRDKPTDHTPKRLRINLGDPDEVRFWMDALGCTEKQLRDAVEHVGDIAGEVRLYLVRNR